jgi:hypothetical protein
MGGGSNLNRQPWVNLQSAPTLTAREEVFYQRLIAAFPDFAVHAQVALSQLIDVPKNHPEYMSIRARFSQLVADFVLYKKDMSIVAVIELDDRSHEHPSRQCADARKDKALKDAGLRLVRIPKGTMPDEQSLRTLIDANESKRIYLEEPVLTLAEDVYAPDLTYEGDDSSANLSEFKRVVVKAAMLAVLVASGWLFYSYLLPGLMRQAFTPLAKPTHAVVVSPKVSVRQQPISQAPVVPQNPQPSAEARRAREQEITALQKQKNLAFASYYSSPASCEHPVDWNAQVECGNLYMRAKKGFELKWAKEHPSEQSGTGVTLDNSSVVGARR